MKKFEVTSRGEQRQVFHFESITELEVLRSDALEGLDVEEFMVVVNKLANMAFGYDLEEKKFYLDVEDKDRNIEQLDKLTELTEDLDDTKPEDKEKIKKIFDENYIQYVIRKEVIITYGEFGKAKSLGEVVADFIVDNDI